ncbi:uncharacterized protein LOC116307630 isoform X2 [Actinia tenebrosa]|uniref:Uncharacterized protein LOC116307630 isoform X2 n=1 Tax=Actinia tenebrosa TaxID=6105 RepID=A0A6P8J2H6_ACTTE|nr:uncharacterized protein LOC116307630 isoform X2 [Actinia tenebrosa]
MELQGLLVLILCAGVFDTKAAPTTLSVDSQGIKPPRNKILFKFDMQVNEGNGRILHEKLEINTKAKTELFSVPKHGDSEEFEVLEDYSMNLTAIHIKAKNICYVFKMISAVLPDEFKTDLENQTIVEDNNTNIKVENTTWKVDAVFTQRSLLSDEMAVLCARSSIYWIQKIEDTGSVRQSRDTGLSHVQRRSVCMNNKICVLTWRLKICILPNGKRQLIWVRVMVCSNILSC